MDGAIRAGERAGNAVAAAVRRINSVGVAPGVGAEAEPSTQASGVAGGSSPGGGSSALAAAAARTTVDESPKHHQPLLMV